MICIYVTFLIPDIGNLCLFSLINLRFYQLRFINFIDFMKELVSLILLCLVFRFTDFCSNIYYFLSSFFVVF